jgi:hypothetical protein
MGKPGTRHGVSLRCEHIAPVEGTRGIETSQYPEERKATATPLVAASEEGRAQTELVLKRDGVASSGLWEPVGKHHLPNGVNKSISSGSVLEQRTTEGKGPVHER